MKIFLTILLTLFITSCSIDTVPIGNPDAGGKTLVRGDLEVASGKTLKVDKIESTSGGQPEGGVPSGMIAPFAGSSAPAGWLLCDGTAYNSVSSPEYAKLYSAIENNWGGSDGTDFKVPDLRGRFLKGIGPAGDGNGGVAIALGQFQDDSTAKNGLANASSTVNTGTITLSGTRTAAGQTGGSHTHAGGSIGTDGDSGSLADVRVYNGGNVGTNAGWNILVTNTASAINLSHNHSSMNLTNNSTHTHSSSTVSGGSWSPSGTWTAQAQSITGDTETQPKSYGVTYIIKI